MCCVLGGVTEDTFIEVNENPSMIYYRLIYNRKWNSPVSVAASIILYKEVLTFEPVDQVLC